MTTDHTNVACRPVVLLCLTVAANAMAIAASAGENAAARAALFPTDVYIDHVRFLASDALAGRDTGSPGIDEAAEYIVRHFRALGLEPAGVDGTFFQPFDVHDGKKLIDASAKLEVPGVEGDWQLREDWITMPFSAMETVSGPLAFAGFGINAPDDEYDDFAGFDAEGKVLMILRGEPKSDDPKAAIGGPDPSRHALFRTKARVGEKQGAKALLIVNARRGDDDKDELYAFDERLQSQTYEIPMLHISRKMADAILTKAGMPPIAELQAAIEKDRKPASRDLGELTVEINPGLEPNVLKARNVIAKLPGESAPDEYIVIGAHYDHVGVRARQFQRKNTTPQIHNGADDNASGTAGLIELARVLSAGPRPRRSILFIAFSGEERGLLGSQHFVKEPTVALDKMRAMLNFDMIGRLSMQRLTIYGINSATEFADLVSKSAAEFGVKYKSAMDIPGNSDHAPFHRKGIPVLFPFTAMHKQYHQPEDDWERIDAAGATQLLGMSHEIILAVANMTDGPTFVDDDAEESSIGDAPPEISEGTPDVSKIDANQAHAAAVKAADAAANRDRTAGDAADDAATRMPKVRLGIMPEYGGDGSKPGLGVEGLVEGGAAEKAGFKDDDRIVQIGDRKVKDIYGYMDAMADVKAGDTVEFTLLRGDKNVTVKVTFPAASDRPGRDGG